MPLAPATMSFVLRVAAPGLRGAALTATDGDAAAQTVGDALARALRQDTACFLAGAAAASALPRAFYAPSSAASTGSSEDAPVQSWLGGVRDGMTRLAVPMGRYDPFNGRSQWTGGACAGGARRRRQRRAAEAAAAVGAGSDGELGDGVAAAALADGGGARPRVRRLQATRSATATPTAASESIDVTLVLQLLAPAPLPADKVGVEAFTWQRSGLSAALAGAQGALAALEVKADTPPGDAASRRAALRARYARSIQRAVDALGGGFPESDVTLTLLLTPASADPFFTPPEPERQAQAAAATGAAPNGAAVGGGIFVVLLVLGAAGGFLFYRQRQRRGGVVSGSGGAKKLAAGGGGDSVAVEGAMSGYNPLVGRSSRGMLGGGAGSSGRPAFDDEFGGSAAPIGMAHTANRLARTRSVMRGVLGGDADADELDGGDALGGGRPKRSTRQSFQPVQAGLGDVFTGASTRQAAPFEGANPLARGGGPAKSTRSVMSMLGVAAPSSSSGGGAAAAAASNRDVTWDAAGFASSAAPAAGFAASNPMSRRDLR